MWDRTHETLAQLCVHPAGHVYEVSVRVREHWLYMRALLWMQVTFASPLEAAKSRSQNRSAHAEANIRNPSRITSKTRSLKEIQSGRKSYEANEGK